MPFFALTTAHGPGWDPSRQIRDQDAWGEHAAFMDALVDDGFILLGGPIGDGQRTLHLVEATDEHEIRARLGEDPWASMELLQIGAVEPWALWLDGRQINLTR
jgi:uncharacterized protein YciI